MPSFPFDLNRLNAIYKVSIPHNYLEIMFNYPQNQRFDKPSFKKALKKSNHGSGLVPHRASLWCGAQHMKNWALDIIFPKICLGCSRFTAIGDFDYVCKKCFGEVSLKNTFECVGCKRQTHLGLTCVFCKKESELDQLLIAAELSDSVIEKMLKTYKYKFVSDMAKPLSVIAKKCIKKLLSKGFNLFEDSPVVISVPLHKNRLNWRGFNQADLLARSVADSYHMPYGEKVLTRVVNAKHQAEAETKEERFSNVKNNFVVTNREAIKGRTVILVDDICTTGATLNECARVLKNPPSGGGAKRVIGFVIARG